MALAETRLRAPIVPKKFFHTAGNFREHEEESKNVDWSHAIAPWINFFQNVDAIVGPDEPVIYPEHLTEELDYELELAVVLKKGGKWFSPEEAMDYVGGYVIFNDITARDIQRGEMKSGVFSFCKAIDTFCPLGPWIVTPDEIADPHDLAMELRVNGEVRQESHSSRMAVTIAEILSNFSGLTYSAGDVLSTGTVSGVAGFKSPEERARLYLKPGDVIEAEIERIGVLRNPVISWQEGHGTPRRRASGPGATPDLFARAARVGLRVDRLEEGPLAALEQGDRVADGVPFEVLRRAVRGDGVLVVVDLEDVEHARLGRVAVGLVEAAPGLLPGEGRELRERVQDCFLGTRARRPRRLQDDRHQPPSPVGSSGSRQGSAVSCA